MRRLWPLVGLALSTAALASPVTSSPTEADVRAQFASDEAALFSFQSDIGTPSHQDIFGGLPSGDTYRNYLSTRIHSIGIRDCGSAGAIACVYYGGSEDDHKMWLDPQGLQISYPQILRLMTILHEARHSEAKQGHWTHSICPTPSIDLSGRNARTADGALMQGRNVCDFEIGSPYGLEVVFAKNVAKFCANCSDKIKMDADMYGDAAFASFQNPPLWAPFFQQLADTAGEILSPVECTYSTGRVGNAYCDDPKNPLLLLVGTQPKYCVADLDAVAEVISLNRYQGVCK